MLVSLGMSYLSLCLRIEEQERAAERGALVASAFWRKRAHVSRLARKLADMYAEAESRIIEVNAIVKPWIAESRRLRAVPDQTPRNRERERQGGGAAPPDLQ